MFFILFFLATLTFLFLIQKIWKIGETKTPPGPKGLPFIGNLHQLDKSQPLFHQLWQLSQKHGPLVYLQLGFVPTIVVSSAKMAREVLKMHDVAFSGRPDFVGMRNQSYNGLGIAFSPYNDQFKELKKICVSQLLNPKRVQSFRPVREEEVSGMVKKIYDFSSASKPVNLSEMTISLTSRIVCRNAFGKSYSDEFFATNEFLDLLSESQAVVGGFYMSDYFPCMGWVDKLNGRVARLERVLKRLDVFIEKIIWEHLNDTRDKDRQEDFIDVLLQIKDDLSSIDLTLDHIKAVLLVDIFTAGTDTGSATVVWAMTELLKHPEKLQKVQNEIRSLYRNKSFINEENAQNVPYLQAVVKETLRLHPPAPLLVPHESTEKCNISGYEIRPKTLLYVNAWAIGRDPEYWEDPEKFLPERFLGSCIDFRGNNFEFVPFGAGRRSCPGVHMGVAIVELSLANILYTFDWDLPYGMTKEDIDMDVKPGITVHKKNPLCLLAKRYFGEE